MSFLFEVALTFKISIILGGFIIVVMHKSIKINYPFIYGVLDKITIKFETLH